MHLATEQRYCAMQAGPTTTQGSREGMLVCGVWRAAARQCVVAHLELLPASQPAAEAPMPQGRTRQASKMKPFFLWHHVEIIGGVPSYLAKLSSAANRQAAPGRQGEAQPQAGSGGDGCLPAVWCGRSD